MKNVNKKDVITFLIIFFISCVIFIPFLQGHYATDTYNVANVGYKNYATNWSLIDGRLVMFAIGMIAHILNIQIEIYVFITLLLALFISDIAIIKLSKIIKSYKGTKNILQEIVLMIMCFVTIFNFMYLENMYYVESVVMALSILLLIISADILVNKKGHYIIKSLVCTIFAVICYQGTIGVFFAYVILFSILKNKENPIEILFDLLRCGVIAFGAAISNIIIVHFIEIFTNLKQTRLGSISRIFGNIEFIFASLPVILKYTCNLFPSGLFLIYLSMLTLLVLICGYKNKKLLYKYVVINLVIIPASYVTYIITLSSFFTGRLRNGLGALIGIILLFLFVETDIFHKRRKISILAYATLISFFVINIINYESIMLQHKEVNKLEKQLVDEIDEYIENYEMRSGKKVTKIVKLVVTNNTDKAFFKNISNKTSLTHNAVRTSWASDGVINFYTGRELETVELEDIEAYLDNDLEYWCLNDTLYVKAYMY